MTWTKNPQQDSQRKSGGRGSRAKNQTTIMRNEMEQEGTSIGHTVNV